MKESHLVVQALAAGMGLQRYWQKALSWFAIQKLP